MTQSDPLSPVTKTRALVRSESRPFLVSKIRSASVTDFNLYVQIDTDYILFAHPGYLWQQDEINRLQAEGHATLYYHTTDAAKVDAYARVTAIASVDTALPPASRVLALTDVGAELTKILYDYPLTTTSLAKGVEIATQMVDVMREDNTCVAALGKLANHDWYTYYHSARVSAYALAIAIEMGMSDPEKLKDISLGCLFHDIGKSRIDLTILNKVGPLSNDEWSKMRVHPELGIDVVESTILGVVPREIILHHHERIDGGGYPHKLSFYELIQEVRIASFADTFDALTTNRPYQPGRSRFDALDLIRHRFLQQLDAECYKAMVTILQRAKVS